MSISTSVQANTYLDKVKSNLYIARAFQYYEGQHRKPLTPRIGEPDDSVIVNLARTIVDVGVSYLFGQDVPFQLEDSPQAKQDYLDLFWKANLKQVLLQKAAVNGAIAGHTFIRILPEKPFPRLIVLDPASVTIDTNPNDCSQVWSYTITPQLETDQSGPEDHRTQRTLVQTPSGQAGYDTGLPNTRWEITDQEWKSGTWVTLNSQTWPWEFPPIADCQNLPAPNAYWGTADLTQDVLHIVDSINRVASHMNKTLRYFAHPITFTKGMGSRQIDRSIDAIIHLPSTEASLNILEMQSDLGSSLAYLDRLLQYLAMVTRIPTTALGLNDALGPISGVALKIRYAPLIQKTEQKRILYGHMIECINNWVLEMSGFGGGDSTESNLSWFNLVPSDDLQEAQVYQAVDNLGIISKRTMADRLGLDYDSELKEMAEEREVQQKLGLAPSIMTGQEGCPCSSDGTTSQQDCTCAADCPGCTCPGKGNNLGNSSNQNNDDTGGNS